MLCALPGGALAVFAALNIFADHGLKTSVYTYVRRRSARKLETFAASALLLGSTAARRVACPPQGCPRIGNRNFSAFVKARLPDTSRVTHWRDPVPHLPFVHGLGPGVSGFWHTSTEIFYNEPSDAHKVCDGSGEDPTCSAQFNISAAAGVKDHTTYFGVAGIGKKTCTPRAGPGVSSDS